MGHIGELDLPTRLARYAPGWATQIALGLGCAGIAIVLRGPLERIAPGVGPFMLGFPMALIATLLGRWPAGLIAAAGSAMHSWFFVMPARHGLAPNGLADRPRLIIAAIAFGILVLIAEGFRNATVGVVRERDRQLAERDLFLRELDHRVKNNFTMVASLLDLQRRRSPDPATKEALGAALARVEGLARAHAHLYRDGASSVGGTDMHIYLGELCAALAATLPAHQEIVFECAADEAILPRDRAVSIGLVVNELVTNAAKYAFADRERGTIRVRFATRAHGWRLTVEDDGIGLPADVADERAGAIGRRLVEAFARQTGGTFAVESGAVGTRFTLDLER